MEESNLQELFDEIQKNKKVTIEIVEKFYSDKRKNPKLNFSIPHNKLRDYYDSLFTFTRSYFNEYLFFLPLFSGGKLSNPKHLFESLIPVIIKPVRFVDNGAYEKIQLLPIHYEKNTVIHDKIINANNREVFLEFMFPLFSEKEILDFFETELQNAKQKKIAKIIKAKTIKREKLEEERILRLKKEKEEEKKKELITSILHENKNKILDNLPNTIELIISKMVLEEMEKYE